MVFLNVYEKIDYVVSSTFGKKIEIAYTWVYDGS